MNSYRISKFDPNSSMSQRRDDWTSISDVGRTFSGEVLTEDVYESVEETYLEAVRLTATEAQIEFLRVRDLVWSPAASHASGFIADGSAMNVERALLVCRAELREELSCHLEADNGFSIDVGFGLYLYVTTPTPLRTSPEAIADLGLYVERGVESPYFNK